MNDKSGIVYLIDQNVPGSLFKDYAEISYEAYLEHTGGYNLSTGKNLPAWGELTPDKQEAFRVGLVGLLENLLSLIASLRDWKSPDGVLQVKDLNWFKELPLQDESVPDAAKDPA